MNVFKVKIFNDDGHIILKQIVAWLEDRCGFKQFTVEYYESNNPFQVFRDHEDFDYAFVLIRNNYIAIEFALRFL